MTAARRQDRGNFILFAALTGGSIDINGVSRTISGTIVAGTFCQVHFASAVTGTDISIVGLQLTFANASYASGSLYMFPIRADLNVAGTNTTGSTFNISNTRISGSITGGAISFVAVYFTGTLTQYETVEFSGNDFSGVTVSGTSVMAIFFTVDNTVTLTGTAASSIVMRGNSARGATVKSTGGTAHIVLWQGPYSGTPLVSGVSTLVIDGFDARDCTLSASTYSQFHAVFFRQPNGMSMVSAGLITINNVWLSGQMSYGATHVSYGAKVAFFQGLPGVKVITVTNSFIDMSCGTGLVATGTSVLPLAYILHFGQAVAIATSITMIGNSMGGGPSPAWGGGQRRKTLAPRGDLQQQRKTGRAAPRRSDRRYRPRACGG